MESYNNNNTNTLAKQLQRPWQSLFGCDSSIWMHKSNIYMRHGFDLGCAAASQRLTTHNSHVEQAVRMVGQALECDYAARDCRQAA